MNEMKTNDNQNYKNLITVEFIGKAEKSSIAGTVFGDEKIRVVTIDEYRPEIKPEGSMLFYKNIDRPEILASGYKS